MQHLSPAHPRRCETAVLRAGNLRNMYGCSSPTFPQPGAIADGVVVVVVGQKALAGVCPVCDHSPLSQEDCKPNSNLRTTVAVFLRTAEKKWALKKAKGEVVEAPPRAEEPVKVEERKEQAAAPEEDVVKVVFTEEAAP